MEWQKDKNGIYHLQFETMRATVHQTAQEVWLATIAREGAEVDRENFSTVQEAQAWCLKRLADLRR